MVCWHSSFQCDAYRQSSIRFFPSWLPGILFAYGITNSGKTYTVNGEPEQAGVLPRSLDIIFNSIVDVQTPRYVSIPKSPWHFIAFNLKAESMVTWSCQLWPTSSFYSLRIYLVVFQVFCPDGGNSYNVFTEEEATLEQRRNKPKKISPRMRYICG